MKKLVLAVMVVSLLLPSKAYASGGNDGGWDSVMVEAKKAFDIARKYASDGLGFVLNLLDKDNSTGLKGDGKISGEVGKESYTSLVKAARDTYNASVGKAKKRYESKIKIAESKDPVDKAMIREAEAEYKAAKSEAKVARDKAIIKAKNLLIDVLDKGKEVLDKKS